MKKNHFIYLTLCLFLASFSLQAQNKTWTWSQYRLQFEAPSNWQVTTNTGEKFYATGNQASFVLIPWNDASVTAKEVAFKAYNTATNVANKRIIAQQEMATKGGLKKYMILMEGTQNGKAIRMGIMGFINPNSSVNMYGRFAWWKEDDDQNGSLTYEIANSIRAY